MLKWLDALILNEAQYFREKELMTVEDLTTCSLLQLLSITKPSNEPTLIVTVSSIQYVSK